MDLQSAENQLRTLHDEVKVLTEKVTKLEVHQESLREGHKGHSETIGKISTILARVVIGGIVAFFFIKEMGILDKLLGQPQ